MVRKIPLYIRYITRGVKIIGNNIQVFENAEFGKIRTVEMNGEPWFVGKDVAAALGYSDTNKAIAMHVDDEDKLNDKTASSLGQRGGWLINESGLYSLVMSSQLPNAKKFKRWVTSEVLPSIRKHGAYITPAKLTDLLCRPESVVEMLTALANEQKKNAELTAENAVLKPKAEFADAVIATNDAILIGTFAKILKQNGVNTGQNRFFGYLRDNDYLISRHGDSYNMPTQKSMDLGLFEVETRAITTVYGSSRLNHITKITPIGQQYFVQKLVHNREPQKLAIA